MPNFMLIIFKCSVLTSKKAQPLTITEISRLMLPTMRETDKRTLCGQNAELLFVEAGGTYNYQ
jgi:hypothetical protein